MADTITTKDVLTRVVQKAGLGIVIPASEIDSLGASALQSYIWFRNANWGQNQFYTQDPVIWRPDAASSADYIRYTGNITGATGTLTPDTAWSDVDKTSETFIILYNGVHPLWIVNALNRGLAKCYTENTEPLSAKPAGTVLADAGFQSTAMSSYVESDADSGPATTFTKVTTANSENVYRGIGSGRVVNAATGGYIRQRFNVTENEPVVVHALSRLASGTNAELVLRDVSNSAFIGSTVEHSQGAWQWMIRRENIPDSCKVLEVRWQGEGSADDVYWGGHSILFPNQARVNLDTKWDTAFKMPSLVSVIMGGTSPANNVYPAMAERLIEIPRSDYDFLCEKVGGNPYAVQFHNNSQLQWFQRPVLIQGRRAYSDFTTATITLAETTSCDLDLADAATRVEMFDDENIRQRVNNPDEKLGVAYGDWLSAKRQFEQKGPAQRTQPLMYPAAGN